MAEYGRLLQERDRQDQGSWNHGNPDAGKAEADALRVAIYQAERELKKRGELPATEMDRITWILDERYPYAGSKDVVKYEGQRYRKRFRPLVTSRSRKTVYFWATYWEKL